MYAIVENGSKQYKAEVGQVIKFEKLSGNVGDKVELPVIMVSDEKGIKVGKEVAGFKFVGEIVEQGKDKKVVVFKYKAKKNERKKQGHRQPFTAVKVLEISKKTAAKANKTEEAPAESAEAK
ncbi:MAG: 50S ribosomal protein L21 [Clostridia bacterium]|nr:50S ribosomal protein L21 [Clostridia bacterium]